MTIEANRPIILGMNGEGTHADHFGNLKCASESVEQEAGADAAPLRLAMNG